MTEPLLVAVDGGNSKTDVVLVHPDGQVAAAVRGGGSNPHFLGSAGALDLIEGLIDTAWRQTARGSGTPRPVLSAGAFFLAGADQPDEVAGLHRAISERRWASEVAVGNDTLALLWAGTTAGFGVAVVVGAGVNGVGRAPTGAEAHFAALGEITGDWGGGAGIGLAALGAAVRGEDGRGPATVLSRLIADHFDQPSALAAAVAVHRGGIAGHRLNELPPLVFEAAAGGDAEALSLVDRQSAEVVSFAAAALRRTGQADDSAEVVVGGSVIAAAPERMLETVRAGIGAVAPRAQVRLWTGRPVVGAAVAVLNMSGSDDAARHRIRAELTDERFRAVDGAGARPL